MDFTTCPICKEPRILFCKCPISDSTCKNNHWWHKGPNGEKVIGEGKHE